ncbi:Sll0314/Alr1548 family TPR repeat-containing protein [Phormidesmis sp. 146-33]
MLDFPCGPIYSWVNPKRLGWVMGATAIAMSLWITPSFAKDPFRTTNPRPIGDKTEAAFKAVFEQGNYKAAETFLRQAEPDEPLAYALQAAMAYNNFQGETDPQKKQAAIDLLKTSAGKTREAADRLLKTDPLRGNLYLAVSNFIELGYVIGTQGLVRGTPQALGRIQQAFKNLDDAEKIAPQDPELNLIKGYIELLLAVNVSLPLSNPGQAIERLERYASPRYLADRGLAIGYRDMNQLDKALVAINRAIAAAPTNPELSYLKAQILVRQGNNKDSVAFFQKALNQKEQLPQGVVKQIQREFDRTQQRLQNKGR